MSKIVTTNLRIPEESWLEVKSLAARMGMSSNEYVKRAVTLAVNSDQIATEEKLERKRKIPFAALLQLAEKVAKMPNKPMGASEEDQVIYGIDD
jgi:hypothetical protein